MVKYILSLQEKVFILEYKINNSKSPNIRRFQGEARFSYRIDGHTFDTTVLWYGCRSCGCEEKKQPSVVFFNSLLLLVSNHNNRHFTLYGKGPRIMQRHQFITPLPPSLHSLGLTLLWILWHCVNAYLTSPEQTTYITRLLIKCIWLAACGWCLSS